MHFLKRRYVEIANFIVFVEYAAFLNFLMPISEVNK